MTSSDDEQDVLFLDHNKYANEKEYKGLYRESRNAMHHGLGVFHIGVIAPAFTALALSDNPSLTQRAAIAFSSLATGVAAYLVHGWIREQPADARLQEYVIGRHRKEMEKMYAAQEPAPTSPTPSDETAPKPESAVPCDVVSLVDRLAEKKSA